MNKQPNQSTVICLMGPTASGKSNLAVELVQRLPCEIISVDSAKVYRGMNIGTAKPSLEELKRAPHRLIDLCDPTQNYSAGQFYKDARREIKDIHQMGKMPLLVGGTMLYFWHLQKGIADLPQGNQTIRAEILNEANKLGWSTLHQKLKKIDSKSAERIHPNDAQRIQRALEIYRSTGQTLSDIQQQHNSQPPQYHVINVILAPEDRIQLHQRIAERFTKMLDKGFVDEVKQLRQRGDLHADLPSIRTVGYRQVWAYLEGKYDYSTMTERGIIATRQLAKRQFTWLRRWKNDAICLNSESHLNSQSLQLVSHIKGLRIKV